jgi:class 3 adenylate cyclase/pimeloyl-ACP methyl ester carboxylesterase
MERRLAAILAADVAGYSRMMAANETATLAALQRHRSEVLTPAITRHHGRVVKLMGDGLLAEFSSVVEAVDCAVGVQREMARRNDGLADDERIAFRIGVHIGDVVVDGDDIYGDGVNVAARLEAIAEVGGVCVSGAAHDEVETKLGLSFRALGSQTLKNIPRPVFVYAVDVGGRPAAPPDPANLKQEIRYCRSPDGVRLAYSVIGEGPPLVRAGSWFTHLEYQWEHPSAGMFAVLKGLTTEHRVLRYDARGNGMSDWEVDEISPEAWVRDMDTVVNAAGFDRFAVLGSSQSVAVAIAYAARFPERVSKLVLYGGYAQGWRTRPGVVVERVQAMLTLMRHGWGVEDPTYRQMFTSQFMPDATKEQWDNLNELQRVSASPECAVRYAEAQGDVDVRHLLPLVQAPTLVMHVRGDLRVPFESGREIAAGIPGARFVALPGRNHILQDGEPATERYAEELRLFLAD